MFIDASGARVPPEVVDAFQDQMTVLDSEDFSSHQDVSLGECYEQRSEALHTGP